MELMEDGGCEEQQPIVHSIPSPRPGMLIVAVERQDTKEKDKGLVTSNPLTLVDRPVPKLDGGSSLKPCAICSVSLPAGAAIDSKNCGHYYCSECIAAHIREKLRESIAAVNCPGEKCKAVFELPFCRPFVPEDVFERWEAARTESSVLAHPDWRRCPGCRETYVNDERPFMAKACPHCWRLFCAECRVPYHIGKTCREFHMELWAKRREAEEHRRMMMMEEAHRRSRGGQRGRLPMEMEMRLREHLARQYQDPGYLHAPLHYVGGDPGEDYPMEVRMLFARRMRGCRRNPTGFVDQRDPFGEPVYDPRCRYLQSLHDPEPEEEEDGDCSTSAAMSTGSTDDDEMETEDEEEVRVQRVRKKKI